MPLPPLTQLDGSSLPSLEGKVILFVNVASRCGYTPQYKGLQALHSELEGRGFTVVGVPCNQFGAQEPGSANEIAEFCEVNYGVSFPLLEKQDVNGEGRSPLYRALVNGGPEIRWNFEKFLVDRSGKVVGRYNSGVRPEDANLRADIERALGESAG